MNKRAAVWGKRIGESDEKGVHECSGSGQLQPGQCIEPLEQRYAPAVVITGTLIDSHNPGDGELSPGDLIHYTETITNTGDTDALDVLIQHLFDNTALVTGSLNVSPLAFDDSFFAVGNTPLAVGNAAVAGPFARVTGSLFANDHEFLGDSFTLSSFSAVSAEGGTVSVNPDGSFVYTPRAGFIGVDTFTYTITDDGAPGSGALTSTGTVTITINDIVWYVDDQAAEGGDGSSSRPFNSLVPLNGPNDVDKAGDHIFIAKGSGSYQGGIVLEDGQKLVGQGADLVVGDYAILTASSASDRPTLSGGSTTITLASGNTLAGINVANEGGGGIKGTNVGNFIIDKVSVDVAGSAAIDIVNGTALVVLDNVRTTGSAGSGVNLENVAGSFSVTGNTTVADAAGIGLRIVDSSANLAFGNVTVELRNATGILIENSGGSAISFGTVTVANPNAAGGYGIRITDSGAAITLGSVNVSGAKTTVAQQDLDADSVPENDGDGDNLFLARLSGSVTIHGGVISDAANDGIDMRDVNNVLLNNLTVTHVGLGVAAGSGPGSGGHGIYAHNLTGKNWLSVPTLSNFDAAGRSGLRVVNSTSTPMTLTLEQALISDALGDGIVFTGTGDARMGLFVQQGEFTGLQGTAIIHTAGGNSRVDMVVTGSSFYNAAVSGLNTVSARIIEGGKANVVIENSLFDNIALVEGGETGVIDLVAAGTFASNEASFTVVGNTIENIGTDFELGYRGINVAVTNNANIAGNILISGNELLNIAREGIHLELANSSPGVAVNAALTMNTVGDSFSPVGYGGFDALTIVSGKAGASTGGQVANILLEENLVAATGTGAAVSARAQGDSTLVLTATFNELIHSDFGAGLHAATSSAVAGGGSPTLFLDVIDNILDQELGVIELEQLAGVLNVAQFSVEDLADSNVILTENVLLLGSQPAFGVSAPENQPPPTPENDPVPPVLPTRDEPVSPLAPTIITAPATGNGSAPGEPAATLVGGTLHELVIGTLPAHKSITVNFAATVTTPVSAGLEQVSQQGTIVGSNFEQVLTDDPDNATGTSDPTTTPITAEPDLRLTQSDEGIRALPGGTVVYTLTYSNAGNQNASGVYLTLHLPVNTSFNAADSSVGWELQPDGSYRFHVGNVAAGSVEQSVVFAVDVDAAVPPEIRMLESSASIQDDGSNGSDPNPNDNSSVTNTGFYQGIFAVGRGKGGTSLVRVFNADEPGVEVLSFLAYGEKYKGGISLAVGDVNGDGYDDIITAKSVGSGSIRVWDGLTGEQLLNGIDLNPFGKQSRGTDVAAADINGDGFADILTGQGNGKQVKIYDGATGALTTTLKPFGARGAGIQVSAGDLDGDGRAEIIAAQKNRVRVFDGETGAMLHNVVPQGTKGPVYLASADVTGDGRADLIVGNKVGTAIAKVVVFSIGTDGIPSPVDTMTPFGANARGAVRVAAVDVNIDGIADILVSGRTGGVHTVKAIDGATGAEIASFACFDDTRKIPGILAASTGVSNGAIG